MWRRWVWGRRVDAAVTLRGLASVLPLDPQTFRASEPERDDASTPRRSTVEKPRVRRVFRIR